MILIVEATFVNEDTGMVEKKLVRTVTDYNWWDTERFLEDFSKQLMVELHPNYEGLRREHESV